MYDLGQSQGKEVFAQAVFSIVDSQYTVLDEAINGGKGLSASNSQVVLSQPWESKKIHSLVQ